MQQLIPYSRGKLSTLIWFVLGKLKRVRQGAVKQAANLIIRKKVHDAGSFHQALTWLSNRSLSNSALIEGLASTYNDAAGPINLRLEAAKAINDQQIIKPVSSKLIRAVLKALPEKPKNQRLIFLESIFTSIKPDELTMKAVSGVYHKSGHFNRTIELLGAQTNTTSQTSRLPHIRAAVERKNILDNGIPLATRTCRQPPTGPARIMYCVSQSRPHLSSGYAIRTHEILSELRSRGLDIEVFARDGFPNDRWDFAGAPLAKANCKIDDVSYHFCPNRRFGISNRALTEYHNRASARITSQIQDFKPTLIHAASNFSCGLPAADAAAKAGLPFIYEMRGLWHLSRASGEASFAGSAEFQLQDRLEIDCAKKADKVLAITQSLADYIIDRGVDPAKVDILPNAVDADSFTPLDRDAELAEQLQLQGAVVIGYIGSLISYEGLDLLLEAVARVRLLSSVRFKLLVIGDGSESKKLRQLAKQLQIQDIVHFTGRVAHEEVLKYYSLVDIVPLPRRGATVCEIVSPLKPFEAMAMAKTLLVSDVAALAEIVTHGETGIIHKRDDAADLADKLVSLLGDAENRKILGAQAREWVIKNRTWKKVCEQVLATYNELGAHDLNQANDAQTLTPKHHRTT